MREQLIILIEEELQKAVQDGLMALEDPDCANRIAVRISDKLTEGRERYRSGRRVYDRLRDRLLTFWPKKR
jgi:hypothetical protein